MLKLRLQYFGHLMWRADSLEKTLILGRTEGRRRGWQRMRCLDSIMTQWTWVWASSGRWWRTGKPGVVQSMGSQRVGQDWVTEQTANPDPSGPLSYTLDNDVDNNGYHLLSVYCAFKKKSGLFHLIPKTSLEAALIINTISEKRKTKAQWIRGSLMAQQVKNLPANAGDTGDMGSISGVWR